MESSFLRIWFRRLAPLILIAIVIRGWVWWSDYTEYQQFAADEKIAVVTAHLWIASAKYRSEPDRYLTYRDSILTANNLTIVEIDALTKKYTDDPDKYRQFSNMVKLLSDSLYQVEQAALRPEDSLSDSLGRQE